MNQGLPTQNQVFSQEPLTSEPKSNNFSKFLRKVIAFSIVITLVAGGLAGYFFLSQKANSSNPEINTDSDFITQQVGTLHKSTDGPTLPLANGSTYVGTQTISLSDVSGGSATGTVTRNVTEKDMTHKVRANIPQKASGSYWIWMANNQALTKLEEIGFTSEGVAEITLSWQIDPKHYPLVFEYLQNTVIISFETVDDEVMEQKILEGTFTQ